MSNTRAHTIRRHLAELTFAAIAVAVAFVLLVPAAPAPLPACPTEDSYNCHWSAPTGGRSFDIVGSEESYTLTYTDGK